MIEKRKSSQSVQDRLKNNVLWNPKKQQWD